MVTHVVHLIGVLPLIRWARQADTRDFCPPWLLQSVQYKKCFRHQPPTRFFPIAQQAGQAVVTRRLSLNKCLCLACVILFSRVFYLSQLPILKCCAQGCHFPRKKYSAEHETDGNMDSFRRNSVCFAERKTLGIPFRSIPRKTKKFGIPFRTISLKANHSELRNFVPNHSAEDKMVWTHIQRQAALHNCLPRLVGDGDKQPPPSSFLQLCWLFRQTSFFRGIPSVPFRTSRHTEFRGITKTVPSLFCGICSERNFLKVWWHAATLFIYFYMNRADIQYFIYTTRRSTTLVVLIAFRSVEGLLWGAEPRFEPGPAVQQAGALLSEPHRTLGATPHPIRWQPQLCLYAGEEVWLYNTPISEDCLYLSVTRPAHKSATPLPVMVGLLRFHREERLGEREGRLVVVPPVLAGQSAVYSCPWENNLISPNILLDLYCGSLLHNLLYNLKFPTVFQLVFENPTGKNSNIFYDFINIPKYIASKKGNRNKYILAYLPKCQHTV